MNVKKLIISSVAAMILSGSAVIAQADQFKLVIMQDDKGAAQKYAPLADYLKTKGVDVTLVGAPDYVKAAQMFAAGEADGMFSGSGVAGTMIIKDLATPVVRPVSKEGTSTYWTVVIAPAGAAKFTGSADYFAGKKVMFASLSSTGEIFYHSLPGANTVKTTIMKAASHGAAIDALSKGAADVAIVKNRIWDKEKSKYSNLTVVGEDTGENPDSTLIVSKKANADTVKKISSALLGLKGDSSAGANAVRDSLNIKEYITTTTADFKHNLELLKKAGIDASFKFAF
ncbi:MAG: PhnD/SsuA/transferrin family substrate-binding protein [Gammaproteobacteria bacterium]|nr:PhnD/SsuA/transferrin family substrate-binding protein [Gammaproteobacteria bacterium]